jgi:hypothetical protein
MTKGQFEQMYAENSGLSVAELHEFGMHAEPCDCEEECCQGWQMVG